MTLVLLILEGGGGEKVIGNSGGDEDRGSGVVDVGDDQVDVNLGGVQEDDPGVAVDQLVHVRGLGDLDLCLHVEPRLCCQRGPHCEQHYFGHCGLVYAFVINSILFQHVAWGCCTYNLGNIFLSHFHCISSVAFTHCNHFHLSPITIVNTLIVVITTIIII